jgi:hypothetical protein
LQLAEVKKSIKKQQSQQQNFNDQDDEKMFVLGDHEKNYKERERRGKKPSTSKGWLKNF